MATVKVVERASNKIYYRLLHVPLWLFVFFMLPGHLTYALYLHGPDRRHAIWLALVILACTWQGLAGRLPGVEPRPYITHYGLNQSNLPYRVVCYTAAWIVACVPFLLNVIGILIAAFSGQWMLAALYYWLYYPLALAFVGATALNYIPRARRSTQYEGVERAWFYVALWTIVPTQVGLWAAWRLGGMAGLDTVALARLRLGVLLLVAVPIFVLGWKQWLPRTKRWDAINQV